MSKLRIAYVVSALGAALAASLAFLPVQNYGIADPIQNELPSHADAPTEFHALAKLFDRTPLPEPAPPTPAAVNEPPAAPPPDPAASLRKYRYLGMAKSDGHAAAVFGRDGQTIILKPGESIDGFKLLSLDGANARFEKEGQDFHLPLSSEP